MATRIYFNYEVSDLDGVLSRSGIGNWDGYVNATIKEATLIQNESSGYGSNPTKTGSSAVRILGQVFVTNPLNAVTFNFATLKAQFGGYEVEKDNDSFFSIAVGYCDSDGSNPTLLFHLDDDTELNEGTDISAFQNRSWTQADQSDYSFTGGQRLIIEVGIYFNNTKNETDVSTIYFANGSGTDLPENDTETNYSYNCWFETGDTFSEAVSDVTVNANLSSLALNTYNTNINAETNILSNLSSLALNTYNTDIKLNVNISSNVSSLALNTYNTNINAETNILSNLSSLVLAVYQPDVIVTAIDTDQPSVVLNTADETDFGSDGTPTVEFTGTDPSDHDITYNIQIDTVNTFDSQTALVDSFTIQNSGKNVQVSGINAIGQSFYGNGTVIHTISFLIKIGLGDPEGHLQAKIFAHTGTFGTDGTPTGSALAVSELIDVNVVIGSYTLISFHFTGSNKITLENSTPYFIVVDFDGGDSSNYIQIGTSTGLEDDGNCASQYQEGAWSNRTDVDQVFYVYSGGPLLNKVSDYDAGFTNTTDGGDTDPFDSGDKCDYTVQVGDFLENDTYYWRVAGADKGLDGSGLYGSWSSIYSFIIASIDVIVDVNLSSLALNTYQTDINAEINILSNLSSLVLNTYQVNVNAETNIQSNLSSLALNTYQTDINAEVNILSNLSSLALNTYQTDINAEINILSNLSSLVLNTYQTDINAEVNILSNLSSLALNTYQTDINIGFNVNVNLSSLVLNTYSANVKADINISSNVASLILETYSADINTGTIINANVSSLALNTYQTNINAEVNILSNLSSLALNTYQTDINAETNILSNLSSLALNTYNTNVNAETNIQSNLSSLALNTYQTSIKADSNILSNIVSLVLVTYNPVVDVSGETIVDANVVSLVLNTYKPTVEIVSNNIEVNANVALLSLETYQTSINAEINIQSNLSSLALNTYQANVNAEISIQSAITSLVLNTYSTDINAEVNILSNYSSLVLNTYSANIKADINVASNSISLVLTTYQANVNVGTGIQTYVVPLVLNTYQTSIKADINIQSDVGLLVLNTYSAEVIITDYFTVDANVASLLLTTYPITLEYELGIAKDRKVIVSSEDRIINVKENDLIIVNNEDRIINIK